MQVGNSFSDLRVQVEMMLRMGWEDVCVLAAIAGTFYFSDSSASYYESDSAICHTYTMLRIYLHATQRKNCFAGTHLLLTDVLNFQGF